MIRIIHLTLLLRDQATNPLVHQLALPPGVGLQLGLVLCVAFPPVAGAALILIHLMALLFLDSLTDGVIHGVALLVHNLLTLLLSDNDTLPLMDCRTNIVHCSMAHIIVHHLADIVDNCLRLCLLHDVALHLGDSVALVLMFQLAISPLN